MDPTFEQCDTLWINATIATLIESDSPYGLQPKSMLGVQDGAIRYIAPMAGFRPHEFSGTVHDVQGRLITPGLIDCHTHLVFAGSRAAEFSQRLQGDSYANIAKKGGGILTTVQATRSATPEQLLTLLKERVHVLMKEGVTLVEIKSGYGLNRDDELKMLRVARQLEQEMPIRVKTTLLAAHSFPKEYQDDHSSWIEYICQEIIPSAVEENLVDAVDVFCDEIGFSLEQTEQVFLAAHQYDLGIRGHVDQFSNLGGAGLAAHFGALSVDHLEYLDESGVQALASRNVVATLLPLAQYCLQRKRCPPIESLRRAQVPMAVASDFNPGSAPLLSLRLAMHMACVLYELTPEEALLGVTRHAAQALGEAGRLGVLKVGAVADFVIWEFTDPAELSYIIGLPQVHQRVLGGVIRNADD